MTVETKMLLTGLMLLGVVLVYGVLKVLGAWFEHHVARHDLVAESKRRRVEYLRALAERDREMIAAQEEEAHASVIIEDDEPMLAQAA